MHCVSHVLTGLVYGLDPVSMFAGAIERLSSSLIGSTDNLKSIFSPGLADKRSTYPVSGTRLLWLDFMDDVSSPFKGSAYYRETLIVGGEVID